MRLLALLLIASQSLAQYGTVGADALNNCRIGGPWQSDAAFAFRSTHTGALSAVRVYVIWSNTSTGYNGGTGGSLMFSVQTDTEGKPSGTTLASVLHSDPMSKGNFPLLTFGSPAKLTKGVLYHLVIQNADARPKDNYVSVNSLYTYESETQPKYPKSDWFQLIRYPGEPWQSVEQNESYTPILELCYSDGYREGNGYMEVWTESTKKISGSAKVRQTFTASTSVTVSRLALRVRRVSGTLTVRLEKANGTLVKSVNVTAGDIFSWLTFPFAASLTKGQAYNLVLSSSGEYQAYPVRDGAGYGFASTFADGYAQYTTGSAWTGWDQWGVANRKDADLQFVFTVKSQKILTDK